MSQVDDVLEQVECAEINLQNLVANVPALRGHLFVKAVQFNLLNAKALLGDSEAQATVEQMTAEGSP